MLLNGIDQKTKDVKREENESKEWKVIEDKKEDIERKCLGCVDRQPKKVVGKLGNTPKTCVVIGFRIHQTIFMNILMKCFFNGDIA